MSLPTREDAKLAEIDTAASNIMTKLRIMRHFKAPQSYRPELREQLQNFVDLAMAFADGYDR